MFSFEGLLESSKSWMNRAAIIQHYNPEFKIQGYSKAQDVINLQKALHDLGSNKNIFQIGEGGTTFRFFSLLLSRIPGTWILKADPRLLQRPQQDLMLLLEQLGCKVHLSTNELEIKSHGWNLKNKIKCGVQTSSQFISGLLLNSWNLPEALEIEIADSVVSENYLKMTLSLLRSCGMQITESVTNENRHLKILPRQIPRSQQMAAEIDLSSAFSLIAAGAIAGTVKITNWDNYSTQPDILFLDILNRMKIQFSVDKSNFNISKQKTWNGININLINAPDLFPVLAILCSQAEGESYLYGASQLRAKESNRLLKTFELLKLSGFDCAIEGDGLKIQGFSSKKRKLETFTFDPDHDHRMAMAAGLLQLAGHSIDLLYPEVVEKSYPLFWHDIQVPR